VDEGVRPTTLTSFWKTKGHWAGSLRGAYRRWWADKLTKAQQVFPGDYTWLTVFNNHAHGVWTEAPAAGVEAGPPRRSATVVRVGTADFAVGK
jgi:hypothetical protein